MDLNNFKIDDELLPRYSAYIQRYKDAGYTRHDLKDGNDIDYIRLLFSHEDLLPPHFKMTAHSDGTEITLAEDVVADAIFVDPDDPATSSADPAPAEATDMEVDDENFFHTQPCVEDLPTKENEPDLVKKLDNGSLYTETNAMSRKELARMFDAMSEQMMWKVVERLCQLQPTDQDKFVSHVATLLLQSRLVNINGVVSRCLECALTSYVSAFPRTACSELLPRLIVSAPSHIHYALILEQLVSLVHDDDDKNTLGWLALKDIASLHRVHLPLLTPLLNESLERRTTLKLLRLMSESATRFRQNVWFGRLLIAAARTLPEEHRGAVRTMVLAHCTAMGERALQILPQ